MCRCRRRRTPTNALPTNQTHKTNKQSQKVIKQLGKGSYGTVFKVQREADGGVYAMKESDMARMGGDERADAVNEIRLLCSLRHPK